VHDESKTSNPANFDKRMAERRLIQSRYCGTFSPDEETNRRIYLAITYFLKTITLPKRLLDRVLPPPRV
jgi:hypothetical protein